MSENGFRLALEENPNDSATNGAYADWLDEQGRHDEAAIAREKCLGESVEEWEGYRIERKTILSVPYAKATKINSKSRARFGPKPAFHHRFRSAEHREKFIAEWKARELEIKERREARAREKKEARANLVNPFKVGDIFYTSWGYDQTNVDWFECIATTDKTVTLREIGSERTETSYMSGRCTPRKGAFLKDAEPIRVTLKVSVHNGEPHVYLPARHGSYYPWDGSSKHWSSYA